MACVVRLEGRGSPRRQTDGLGRRAHRRHRLTARERFSETNDNSVATLLSYGTAGVLLAGDAEAREEEYMPNGPYTGPLTVINVPKLHTV